MGTGTAERAARLQRDSTARGQRDAGLALSVHPVPIGTKTAEPGNGPAGCLLTPSQLSMVADKAREYYDKAAKERQKDHGGTAPGKGKNTSGKLTGSDGDARDAAGKALGVSGRSVDFATPWTLPRPTVSPFGSWVPLRPVPEGSATGHCSAHIYRWLSFLGYFFPPLPIGDA